MAYKNELRKKIKACGRTRKWVETQLGYSRTTFWRRVNSDSLTKEEKEKLNSLLK